MNLSRMFADFLSDIYVESYSIKMVEILIDSRDCLHHCSRRHLDFTNCSLSVSCAC